MYKFITLLQIVGGRMPRIGAFTGGAGRWCCQAALEAGSNRCAARWCWKAAQAGGAVSRLKQVVAGR